jgi:hypothetical protein
MALSVGVLELLAHTAALSNRFDPVFWAELPLKRQLYSVMPQAVSVWARQAGCRTFYATHLGLGRVEDALPPDLDLVFIAAPTQHAAVAYAAARVLRRRGTRVALAGPHARAFPQDCARFADIVVTDCDRRVVEEILRCVMPRGTILKSARPLTDLPLVEEREPEIRAAALVRGRVGRITTISLLSSPGCPYACDFCSEWRTRYLAFDTDRMRRELETIAVRYPGALIGFHDPNFGVRFDETMAAFENSAAPRANPFLMEASLSLLNAERLARLRSAGCVMTAPGIESWADYSNKSRATRASGEAKYRIVSEMMKEVEARIPAVQANLILGVDADAGDEPFDLTERFIREHPGVWTNANIPIPFGSTPFAERVRREGRLIEALPFPFYTAPYLALRPKNYDVRDYLDRLGRIYDAMCGWRLLRTRLARMPSSSARSVVIARTLALRVERAELHAFRTAVAASRELRRFLERRSESLPEFFASRLASRFGKRRGQYPGRALRPWSADHDPARPVVII